MWYDDDGDKDFTIIQHFTWLQTATLTLHSLEKMPYYATAAAGDGFCIVPFLLLLYDITDYYYIYPLPLCLPRGCLMILGVYDDDDGNGPTITAAFYIMMTMILPYVTKAVCKSTHQSLVCFLSANNMTLFGLVQKQNVSLEAFS